MFHRTTESASAPIGHPAVEDAAPGRIEYVERLSLRDQFRLIEIAHESRDPAIRKFALQVLHQYLNPPCIDLRKDWKIT